MYKFIFDNFCFILTATPADHFFWVVSFTEFIKVFIHCQINLEFLELQPASDHFPSNREFRVDVVFFFIIYMYTHTRIYMCVYIYTHTVTDYVHTYTHIQNCSKYWTAYICWKKFLPTSVLQRKSLPFLAFISHMEGKRL